VRTTILLAGLLLITGLLTAAETPTEAEKNAAVAKWIEQLADPDFQKRDEALDRLRDEGPSVIPALRKALSHPDPEVRRRLRDLVPNLETSLLLTPKRVSLKMTAPLQDIFKEITRQTGYKIESWSNTPQQQAHTFDFPNVTFWEAIDRIGQQTGLVVQRGYGDDRVVLQPQNAIHPHVWRDGSFRFVADSMQQSRQIDLFLRPLPGAQPGAQPNGPPNGPPSSVRSESLIFSFTVFVEPKLPILGAGEVRLSAAFDNERNSLVPPSGQVEDPLEMRGVMWRGRFSSGRYGNRGTSLQTQVSLQRASEKASTIKLLKGSVPVNLLAEQKPVTVTDKLMSAKGLKEKIGPVHIAIEDVKETENKQYQIAMNLSNENAGEDYSWSNSLYQRLEVLDAKGNKMPMYGSSWGGGAGAVRITMTFGAPNAAKPEPPTKLIFHSWTTLETTASFEFRDIPLP
jgi:hypothetical protein